jgi:histone-lysine N-methyltransferase SETD3
VGGIEELVEWLTQGGARCEGVTIEQREGERGVCARRPIAAGDLVMEIPRRFIITYELVKESEIGRRIEGLGITLGSHASFMAAYLLEERRNPRSFFQPWFHVLPTSYVHMPFFLREHELAYLKGSVTLERIRRSSRSIRADYSKLRRGIPGFQAHAGKEFAWARFAITSRVFGVAIDGKDTHAMVPLADMFNHKIPRETKWDYDEGAGAFVVTALRDFAAGEPVRMSYGGKCNSDLYLSYGFVFDENEYNRVAFNFWVPEEDPFFDVKREALAPEGVIRRFSVPAGYHRKEVRQMFWFLRVVVADAEEVARMSVRGRLTAEKRGPVSARNEQAVLAEIEAAAEAALAGYDTTVEEDNALLRDLRLPPSIRACIMMRRGEKCVFRHYIALARTAAPLLSLPLPELMDVVSARHGGAGEFDFYIKHVVVRLAEHLARGGKAPPR